MLKQLLKPLASLRLTVVLLAMAIVLVLAGTLAQRFEGIWQVQAKYFHSFGVLIPVRIFLPAGDRLPDRFPFIFPFVGGYTLGTLLLVNLLAAHFTRFVLSWKRAGIWLVHIGLIMLLLGEGLTSGLAHEGNMMIDQGGSSNYTYSMRQVELAVVDHSPADHDRQVVVPGKMLEKGGVVADPKLPFDISVEDYYPNADILPANIPIAQGLKRATAGDGAAYVARSIPVYSGAGDGEKVDAPASYMTLYRQGQPLGTYLVSANFMHGQAVQVDGKNYSIALRFARTYRPYTMQLIKFSHDKYLGTEVAKNYSSLVRLVDPQHHVDREVLIKMNSPLRYRGETFYQSSFRGDTTTVLQVVDNPAWTMPYIACSIGALGLVFHFGMMLIKFLSKRLGTQTAPLSPLTGAALAAGVARAHAAPAPAGRPGAGKAAPPPPPLLAEEGRPWFARLSMVLPLGVLAIALVTVGSRLMPKAQPAGRFDMEAFARLPISYEGRIQPLDSISRNTLRILRGRQDASLDKKSVPAVQWFIDNLTAAPDAGQYKIFRIDFPGILDMLGLDRGEKYFSVKDVSAGASKLFSQSQKASEVPRNERDMFQSKVIEQTDRFQLYTNLSQIENLYLCAPLHKGEHWESMGTVLASTQKGGTPPESFTRVMNIMRAYAQDKPEDFNREVKAYQDVLATAMPRAMERVNYELFFNEFQPFWLALYLYVAAFLLGTLSWLVLAEPLRRSALMLLGVALALHTFGLVSRIYISGRPPVTNLASSAIFIGWVSAVVAVGLERIYRNGVGIVAACAIAFPTLFIADRLALDGDTMKVLVAVLDTNIWLATHVVVITIGYAATFLAGMLGLGYIFFGMFTRSLTPERRKNLIRMVYGVTCFALIGSFVGTILGGIWADQSWGRFWGWDPKENGAVLIVLANALLLHARWGGLVRERGIAGLAVFGNIVTAWSWFGTNMLGVGLHSYGFMSGAFWGLLAFVFIQVVFIVLACLPESLWLSMRATTAVAAPPIPQRAIPLGGTR